MTLSIDAMAKKLKQVATQGSAQENLTLIRRKISERCEKALDMG